VSTTTHLTCPCGERIERKDVLHQGRCLRLFSPRFVYVKFRCSHCKRLGERFVPRDQWEEDKPEVSRLELSAEEAERLADLGAISVDEVVDFHFLLEGCTLADLFGDLHH